MKKISRILSFLFSALFAVVFAFSAWCGWMLQYSIQNYFTLQEKFSWMGSSPGDWEARFQTWSAVALGYVAPVLLLLLIVSLIWAKYSWKDMACHLFFTLSAGFFLIFLTQFISVHSARNIYISLYQTFSYLLADPLAENWSGGEGLMLTVLLAPVAVGLYALATALKKRQQ